MTSIAQYTILFMGLYALALIVIGWMAYKRQAGSQQGFVIGNRQIGSVGTLCSLAAGQFSGAVIFIFFAKAPSMGYGLMWMPIGATVGMLTIAMYLKTIHKVAGEHDYVTLTDMIEKRVGRYTGYLSTLIICAKALLLVASQLYISGNIFASIFGIPTIWSIVTIAFCVMLYLWLGGYMTVIRTDVLQVVLMVAAIVVPMISFRIPEGHNVFAEIAHVNDKTTGLFLFILLLALTNAEIWQRLFSVKSLKSGVKGFMLGGPVLMSLVFCAITFALGSYAVMDNVVEGKGAFFALFQQTALPAVYLAMLCVFVTAAIMSTIDTQVNLFASTMVKNVLKINDQAKHADFVRISRIITVVMLATLSLVAVSIGDILEFIFKAISVSFVLVPALLIGCANGIKKDWAFDYKMTFAMICGMLLYSYMFFNGYLADPIYTAVPPVVATLMFMLLYAVPFKQPLWLTRRGGLKQAV